MVMFNNASIDFVRSTDRSIILFIYRNEPLNIGDLFVMKIGVYNNPSKLIAFLEKIARKGFENELLLTSEILFLFLTII